MLQAFKNLDSALTTTRPGWGWLGQLAVLVLGVHLAADRLDDRIYDAFEWASLPWPDPSTPAFLASWSAVGLELMVVAWATWTLWAAHANGARDWEHWKEAVSVNAIVRALFWLPVALTGAWVVGMSAEDLVAPLLVSVPGAARWVSFVVSGLIAWRLSLTGWWTVASAARKPGAWWEGLFWAPVPLAVAFLAVFYGLPIWGLL